MREKKAVCREYAKRYQKSRRRDKSHLLTEFVDLTGYRRDYASFLLKNWGRRVYFSEGRVITVGDFESKRKKSGRRKKYDFKVYYVLVQFWELLNHPCGKRLKTQLEGLVEKAKQFEELKISKSVHGKLLEISSSTIDRLLESDRKKQRLKARSKTKPGSLLKRDIPIRTGVEWDEDEVGYLEIDLVSHDGGNARGDFCFTLNSVDIKSGWNDFVAIKNKAQIWVLEALKEISERLPFPLKGIDSDNGSEFINNHLMGYCKEKDILFTRSRPSRKNDNCHVEEKNYSTVRTYVGYFRYDTDSQRDMMNNLYSHLRVYMNYFQPRMKLIEKKRIGSKIIKKYDTPKTACQRILDMDDIDDKTKETLKRTYQTLNPFMLKRSIDKIQNSLFRMAYLRKKGIS